MLNGVSSPVREVNLGVPQGSILGPLLFLLSVNSIFDTSLSYNAIISLYAHDILLYKEIKCDLDLVAFQSDVSLVVEWVLSVHLQLNSMKTKSLLISRKRQPPTLALEVNGVPIETVSSFRYLGVTISGDLRLNLHIDAVCARAHRLLGFLYRSFRGGDFKSLSYLYKSLVLPVLGYCTSVWDPQQQGLSHKLDRVQGFAAHLATGRWDDDWQSLCSELGWCQLAQRRKYEKIRMCRRILPSYPPLSSHHCSVRAAYACACTPISSMCHSFEPPTINTRFSSIQPNFGTLCLPRLCSWTHISPLNGISKST